MADRSTASIAWLQKRIYDINQEKGWFDGDRSFGDLISLIHSELSEALEEFRSGHPTDEIYFVDGKPEGVPIELADVMIRVLDLFTRIGADPEEALLIKIEYNSTRPYRHGGKTL